MYYELPLDPVGYQYSDWGGGLSQIINNITFTFLKSNRTIMHSSRLPSTAVTILGGGGVWTGRTVSALGVSAWGRCLCEWCLPGGVCPEGCQRGGCTPPDERQTPHGYES